MATLNLKVSANLDDAQFNETTNQNNAFNNYYSAVGLRSGSLFSAAARFIDVLIARGAIINSARLRVNQNVFGAVFPLTFTIYGELSDHALDFEDVNPHFPSRPKTLGLLQPNFTGSGEWLEFVVTSIIQEIVNQEGWLSGSALALMLIAEPTTLGNMRLFAHANDPAKAAELIIDYTEAAEPPPPPPPPTPTVYPLPDTPKFQRWLTKRIDTGFSSYVSAAGMDFTGFFTHLKALTVDQLLLINWNNVQSYVRHESGYSPAAYAAGQPILVNGQTLEAYADRVVYDNGTYMDRAGAIFAGGVKDAIMSLVGSEWLVFVKTGTYIEFINVTKGNWVLAGEGWNTVIRQPDGVNRSCISVIGRNVIVRDMVLDGNRDMNMLTPATGAPAGNQDALETRAEPNFLAENVFVVNCRQFGMNTHDNDFQFFINNVSRDCGWNNYEFTRSKMSAGVANYGDTCTDVSFSTWGSELILIERHIFETPLGAGLGATRWNGGIGIEGHQNGEQFSSKILVKDCDCSDLNTQSDRGSGLFLMEYAHHLIVDGGRYNNNNHVGVLIEKVSWDDSVYAGVFNEGHILLLNVEATGNVFAGGTEEVNIWTGDRTKVYFETAEPPVEPPAGGDTSFLLPIFAVLLLLLFSLLMIGRTGRAKSGS